MSRKNSKRFPAWMQVFLLTLVFGGLYFALRSLPDAQCGFLHYEVVDVLADGTEVCSATNHAEFVDLSRFRYPIELELDPLGPLQAGRETEFRLRIRTPGGEVLLPHELAIVHTERIHLMVVDPSLSDYHHLHPRPEGATGDWSFFFTPASGGDYRFFAEMAPVRTRRQAVAFQTLVVEGPVAERGKAREERRVAQSGNFRLEMVTRDGLLRRNRENSLILRISRDDGERVELEQIMGAYAHLVAFDEGLSGYAHMHPFYEGKEGDDAPEVTFLFVTPKTGAHRIWAQVKLEGREVFAPFMVLVQ